MYFLNIFIRQMSMTLKFLKGPRHVRKRLKEIIIHCYI